MKKPQTAAQLAGGTDPLSCPRASMGLVEESWTAVSDRLSWL